MITMDEIYQQMAAEFQARTGLSTAGCGELAARFYAVAAQLYGLYVQADWLRQQCFPQTATGEQLDQHALMRGLTRQDAVKATGTVRFYLDGNRRAQTEIPVGTVCMTTGGLQFVTTQRSVVTAGATEVDVPVQAVEGGAAGNVSGDTVVCMAVPPLGSFACTNPGAMSGGQEAESDEELRQRVLASYQQLSNGANSAYYRQTALAVDGVAAVAGLPRNRGVGTVDVVAASQSGMPEDELLTQLSEQFQTVREIAVDVQVLPPTPMAVDVSVTLTAKSGADFAQVAAAAESALRGWFNGERLGCPVLRAELTALLFGVEGVANCAVILPEQDIPAESVTLPVLGQLTISEG